VEDTPSNPSDNPGAAKTNQPQFAMQSVYVKDISLETPNSPEIFLKQWTPKPPELHIHRIVTPIEHEGFYEVVLHVTVSLKTEEDKTAYLVELQQAGIFMVRGFPEERLAYMVNVICAYSLFPYAREAVSSLVTRGGFPPLLLPQIDFDAMYAQQQRTKTPQGSNGKGE
jgi:preprotein translocase subunit SecB